MTGQRKVLQVLTWIFYQQEMNILVDGKERNMTLNFPV